SRMARLVVGDCAAGDDGNWLAVPPTSAGRRLVGRGSRLAGIHRLGCRKAAFYRPVLSRVSARGLFGGFSAELCCCSFARIRVCCGGTFGQSSTQSPEQMM